MNYILITIYVYMTKEPLHWSHTEPLMESFQKRSKANNNTFYHWLPTGYQIKAVA